MIQITSSIEQPGPPSITCDVTHDTRLNRRSDRLSTELPNNNNYCITICGKPFRCDLLNILYEAAQI